MSEAKKHHIDEVDTSFIRKPAENIFFVAHIQTTKQDENRRFVEAAEKLR